jgi:predicted transcriptional regulator
MAEREVVLGLAAEIVPAHVSNNAVPADQLPGLALNSSTHTFRDSAFASPTAGIRRG